MIRTSRWVVALGCLALGIAVGAFLSGSLSLGRGPELPPVMPRELTSYRDVVKRVLPGVVSIEARSRARKAVPNRQRSAPDGGPNPNRPNVDDPERRPELPDDGNLGFGSGFIVDSSGIILTNYHVVEGADELEVQTYDGRKMLTTDFVSDMRSDIAVVRVKVRSPLPALEFGDSEAMEIGDRVLAMGAPFGLKGSVTAGIISAKGRSLRQNNYEDFFLTDAAVNPGNSGGPLVNLEGRVVGITSAIKSRSGGFQGVGLAIASNLARSIQGQLLKSGVVHRGYLGAIVDDLDPETLIRIGVRGVRTKTVVPNSPAALGGIRVGDVITMINDRPIKDGREMQRIVGDLALNRSVGVSVLREGKLLSLNVTITDFPASDSPKRPAPPVDR